VAVDDFRCFAGRPKDETPVGMKPSATTIEQASVSDLSGLETDRVTPHRGLRRVPNAVWLITALNLVLLLLYATLLPTWRAPDEPEHVDLVLHVAQTHSYPRYDGLLLSPAIINSLRIVHFNSQSAHLVPSEAIPRGHRPSFRSLDHGSSTEPNQIPQHPPLYYATLAAAWRAVDALVPGGIQSFDREVWVLRALSALFVLPLPLVAWAIAERLRLNRRAAIVAALVPLGIPELTHIGSAVNNDSLLALLGAVSMLPCLRLAAGDLRPRVAVAAGVLGGLALFTKGFGFVFVVTGLLAIVLGAGWKHRHAAMKAVVALSMSAFAFGGWWWLRNLLAFGHVQPSVQLLPAARGFSPDWASWIRIFFTAIFRRFWGDFGWFDVALPSLVIAAASTLSVALVIVAFLRAPRLVARRERRTLTNQMLVLLCPCVGLVLFVAVQAASSYKTFAAPAFIQGRYLFGGVAGVAVLMAVGVSTLGRRVVRAAPLLALGAAVTVQLVAVHQILGFYWGPPNGGLKDQLRSLSAWSPWPPPLLAGLAVAGAILLLLLLVAVVATAIERGTADAERTLLRTPMASLLRSDEEEGIRQVHANRSHS
jgi:small subunit ribosomal protein S36